VVRLFIASVRLLSPDAAMDLAALLPGLDQPGLDLKCVARLERELREFLE
jgi:hypothetical protein